MLACRFLSIAASFCLLPNFLSAGGPPHVELSGEAGHAADISAARFRVAPFNSLPWLRADLTNETVSERH